MLPFLVRNPIPRPENWFTFESRYDNEGACFDMHDKTSDINCAYRIHLFQCSFVSFAPSNNFFCIRFAAILTDFEISSIMSLFII